MQVKKLSSRKPVENLLYVLSVPQASLNDWMSRTLLATKLVEDDKAHSGRPT